MLRKLLHLVTEKGTVNDSELACELGISQALLKQILGELVRQGYLQPLTRGNSVPCKRCQLHMACLYGNQPRIFALTAKGDRIVADVKFVGAPFSLDAA